ncbi:MAG: hypothetical protein JWQ98_1569 [Chlorobi bacterium]|nr:hypothetical protein [Chlorobiota bacterium]
MHTTIGNPDLRAALQRLFSLQTFGIKLGLEPITELLHETGDPHLAFPAIHVAGTNGKGSTCAMIASILTAAGLRVGLYSSPHLVSFDERIRVNGIPISEADLSRYATEMLPVIERIGCTFFEGTTAMGFRYFAEQRVDVAVIETGLGGRLDATNVLAPLVSAITSISFDHMKHLGNTLEEIAGEKAGIIKPGAPAVIGPVGRRLRDIFDRAARDAGAPVRFVDDFCRGLFHELTFDGTVASFMIDGHEIPRVTIDLAGRHQIDNARVALGAIDAVRDRFGITGEIIREGLGSIRRNTGIRGRFETIRTEPRVILDVAHNPDGARVLTESLREAGGEPRVHFVYGAVQDKDVEEILKILAPFAASLHAVRADNHRSLPAAEIAFHADSAGIITRVSGTVANGIEEALMAAGENSTIVICGSFYVVADAIEHLEGEMIPQIEKDTDRVYEGDRGAPEYSPHGIQARPEEHEPMAEARMIDRDGHDRNAGAKHRPVKDWRASEQPRERLMTLGPRALSDSELLAILLRTGRKGEDVIQMSRNILHRFETIAGLSERDFKELEQVPGIGPAKAVTLAAAFEIGKRIKADPFAARTVISSPEDVARIYIPMLRGIQKEQFHVIILNSANQVLRMSLVSEGNLNSSIVHPREVYRIAIVENAASIIGLHNHPSGNPTPSKEDISITRQLVEAGRIIGIPFHDHIIIAGDEHVSLAERGYV